jgi:hypothetical protein
MIEISESAFAINGNFLIFPIAIKDLSAMLGEPQHKKTKHNHIYTFHQHGLVAYSQRGLTAETLNVIFGAETQFDFSPKNFFNQSIVIGGASVKDFYRANKKKLKAHGSMQFGQFNLYFDATNDGISLLDISATDEPQVQPMADKYKVRKVKGDALVFTDFNFKLAVMQELMYNLKLLKPKFDLYEFVKFHNARDINVEAEGYEFIPEVIKWFEQFEIEVELADKVKEIHQDGGNEIYANVLRFWDGEDDVFNIRSFKDATQFKNLKSLELFHYKLEDQKVLKELKPLGIKFITI